MQKIYLLLRNNRQTGPWSLDEMIASGLKPFDLIWVEGRSAGWRYPSEIDSLKPYLPQQLGIPEIKSPEPVINQAASYPIATPIEATLKTTGKHIFVSMPAGVNQRIVEQPVENPIQDVPQVIASNYAGTTSSQTALQSDPISETRYNRSLNELEQDYTNWVFKSKKKKSSIQLSQQSVVFGTVGVLVCAVLYFGISKMVSKNNSPGELAKSTEQKQKEYSSIPVSTKVEETVAKPEIKGSVTIPTTTNDVQQKLVSAPVNTELRIETGNHKTYSNHTGKKSAQSAIVKKPAPQVNQIQTSVAVKQPDIIKQEQTTAQIQRTSQASTKKKGLSAFFNGVFGKLKKKNNNTEQPVTEKETTQGSPKISSETMSNGERRATRRNDDANEQSESKETETVNEKDFAPQSTLIDLEGSERNNSWQLGIYDLKLTLLNRNNVPVRSAGVEVLYFDENNRLLEKKIVYFTNIAARSRSTVKVPDQKWADHTDYKLIALK